MAKIAVMGAGSWGTTFAKVLADNPDNQVVLWARREDVADEINQDHRNGDYRSPRTRMSQPCSKARS
jgi:glycerol-3-phosphate dehydrogenase (NAD(P)+)